MIAAQMIANRVLVDEAGKRAKKQSKYYEQVQVAAGFAFELAKAEEESTGGEESDQVREEDRRERGEQRGGRTGDVRR